ncbi:MAG TPA: flagellin [Steroidobacteraceae bacterium]|nr:flagellin [Steroidobacteraceae bacterium]
MSLVLNTNINSLVAQSSLTSSGAQLATSLQQLSSGLRINTAADDAAGYAIVQGMNAQIGGLNQAAQNATAGVSLTQTAQGALTEITNDLQTMRDLAVESLNATNSAADRADLNQQYQQLAADINNVAGTAAFNGVNLLDGSFQGATFQIGANAGQTITVSSVASATTGALGAQYAASAQSANTGVIGVVHLANVSINGTALASSGTVNSTGALVKAINAAGIGGVTASTQVVGAVVTASTAGHTGTLVINGVATAAITATGTATTDVASTVAAINAITAATGVSATTNTTGTAITLTDASGGAISVGYGTGSSLVAADTGLGITGTTTGAVGTAFAADVAGTGQTITINGVATGLVSTAGGAGNLTADLTNVANAINGITTNTGVSATLANSQLTLTSATGSAITVAYTGSALTAAETGLAAGADALGNSFIVNYAGNTTGAVSIAGVGADLTNAGLTAGSTASTQTGFTVANTSVLNVQDSNAAIAAIDAALQQVAATGAQLGAYQNRFTAAITGLNTDSTNLQSARSSIQDTNYASATSQLSQAQILQQASTAMVAQANLVPQNVLTLLQKLP